MARSGSQVTYYLDNGSIAFLASQAAKYGISKSKAMKMAMDLWKGSEDYLLENFGRVIPTSLELLSQMVAVERAANEKNASAINALTQATAKGNDMGKKDANNAQA